MVFNGAAHIGKTMEYGQTMEYGLVFESSGKHLICWAGATIQTCGCPPFLAYTQPDLQLRQKIVHLLSSL